MLYLCIHCWLKLFELDVWQIHNLRHLQFWFTMFEGGMCLKCSLSPERPSWGYRCGVFFNVTNKTDEAIFITGLTAGSHGGNVEAMLYACVYGASNGHETEEDDWKVIIYYIMWPV